MSDMGLAKRTARARADRLMAIERARDPLLTKVRSAVGSTRANPVFGTRPLREDIEAAGQGTSAYAGQTLLRGEQVRKDMARRVRALASDDRASRTALKIFGREDTPAPARALIKKERQSVLPTPGSGGTANRTNAGWDRAARVGGHLGRSSAAGSLALGAARIGTSDRPVREAAGVAGSAVGGIAGGIAGAEAGAALGLLGGPLIPYTVPAGAVIGGFLGSMGGGALGDRASTGLYDDFNAPRTRNLNRR